jgi:hypothetical protein
MRQRWNFTVPRNTPVFTTKGLIRTKEPILVVIHDQDGDWQFLGAQPVSDTNCSVVGLGAIVDYDPTVNAVASMARGSTATRFAAHQPWTIARLERP